MQTVLLYGCESWTLTANLERRIQCSRKVLGTSYREHVWQQVTILAECQELLLSTPQAS